MMSRNLFRENGTPVCIKYFSSVVPEGSKIKISFLTHASDSSVSANQRTMLNNYSGKYETGL